MVRCLVVRALYSLTELLESGRLYLYLSRDVNVSERLLVRSELSLYKSK